MQSSTPDQKQIQIKNDTATFQSENNVDKRSQLSAPTWFDLCSSSTGEVSELRPVHPYSLNTGMILRTVAEGGQVKCLYT